MAFSLVAPNERNFSLPSDRPAPEEKQKGMFLSAITNAIGQLRQPAGGVGVQMYDTNQDQIDQQNTFVAYGILFALVIAGFYLITKIK